MPLLETPSNPAPPVPEPPAKLVTRRFGELEQHELVYLLDSIDDEIARARFRESIYVSVIICLAIAWFAFYGPRVLFHQGRIANPKEEVTRLDKPMPFLDLPKNLVHKPPPKAHISDQDRLAQNAHPVPEVKTTPPPPRGAPLPPAPTPAPQPRQAPPPPQQAQQSPTPPTPQPQPQPKPSQTASIPDAPKPTQQGAGKPNFAVPGQSLKDLAAGARAGGQGGDYGSGPASAHSGANTGVDILSNTLGTDFGPYIKRLLRILRTSWYPLIPEETMPPLNKEGWTLIRFRINADGTVSYMHLDDSTHDRAIDGAAWHSITGVGQFPPLPKEFKGPNLDLRIDFIISKNPPREE